MGGHLLWHLRRRRVGDLPLPTRPSRPACPPLLRSIAMIHRQSRGQLPLFVQGLEAFKQLKVGMSSRQWKGSTRLLAQGGHASRPAAATCHPSRLSPSPGPSLLLWFPSLLPLSCLPAPSPAPLHWPPAHWLLPACARLATACWWLRPATTTASPTSATTSAWCRWGRGRTRQLRQGVGLAAAAQRGTRHSVCGGSGSRLRRRLHC